MKATLVGTAAGLSAALAFAWLGPRPAAPPAPAREPPFYADGSSQDLAERYAPPITGPATAPHLGKLARVLPHVTCEKMPLGEFIEAMRKSTGAQFYVEWERMMGDTAVGPETPVNMMERNIVAADALRMALAQVSGRAGPPVQFRVIDGIVKVTTRFPRRTLLRAYDVRDLIERGMRHSEKLAAAAVVASAPNGPAISNRDIDEAEQAAVAALNHGIDEMLDADGWRTPPDEQSPKSAYFAGRLVVNQTEENHARITALLAALRAKAQ